jgi:hypothetical protein
MNHVDNSSSYSNKSLGGGLNYIHSFDTNDTKLSSDLDFSMQQRNKSNAQEYNYYIGDDITNWLRRKGQTADELMDSKQGFELEIGFSEKNIQGRHFGSRSKGCIKRL